MCCGEAADKSDDKVKFEEGERIVEDDGDDGVGEAARLDGIPTGKTTAAMTESRVIFGSFKQTADPERNKRDT